MTLSKKFLHFFILSFLIISAAPKILAQTAPANMPSFTTEPANPNTITPYKIIAEVKPGDTYQDAILLTNNMNFDMALTNSAADKFINNEGNNEYTTSEATDDLFRQWTTIEEKTDLAPGESKVINFSLTIPENTSFGVYEGGITTTLRGNEENNIITSYRIVTPLEIKVTDDPQKIPKLVDQTQTNIFAPTPYFWVSVLIFLSSMSYFFYANKKEKKKRKNQV